MMPIEHCWVVVTKDGRAYTARDTRAAAESYARNLGSGFAAIKVAPVEEWKSRPGEMHPVDEAFYRLAIKERDFERVKVDRLESENAQLRADLDRVRSQRDALIEHEAAMTKEIDRLRT
jgi:hypothetical protein